MTEKDMPVCEFHRELQEFLWEYSRGEVYINDQDRLAFLEEKVEDLLERII
ncbi:MAG: hypothetical protein JXA25_05330 [Anaerolineales bacterium]|nr:hypothetical protein [Anaerolineales bacterium]